MRSDKGLQRTDQAQAGVYEQLRAAGISPSTYYGRLRRGWSKQDALAVAPRAENRKRGPDRANGIGARLRAAGISRTTYYQRLRRGWSPDQALGSPVGETVGRKPRLLMPDGQAAVDVARRNGVEQRTFYRKLQRGVPLKRAVRPD